MRREFITGPFTSARRVSKLALLAALGVTAGCRTIPEGGATPSPLLGVRSPELVQAANIAYSDDTPDAAQVVAQVAFDEPVAPVATPAPNGQAPNGQAPNGQAPEGQAPEGQAPNGPDLGSPLGSYLSLGAADAPLQLPLPVANSASSGIEDRLTLERLEAISLASHPAIAEARARVDSTRGQYVQAGLPFNPVLLYRSDEIGNENSSGLHVFQLSQQFVTADKLGKAQQVQAYEVQKQQARLRIAELTVLTQVRAAFARAVVSQQRAELTRQIVVLAESSVASVVSLVEAKEVSNIELLQSKVEAEQARIAAENAATQLEANRRTLAAAIGLADLPAVPLSGTVSEQLEEAPWEALLAEISATSPEISGAGSELERARWSLSLARAQVIPNITGVLGVGVDTSTNDTFARIGINVPLPIRNRNQGNIRSARADISVATAAIERTQRSIDSRLAGAVGRYQVARERYDRLRTTVVPAAAETFELSRKAFEAGETGFLQLLTAQRTLFSTRLSVLDALVQAKEAIADIDGLLVALQP